MRSLEGPSRDRQARLGRDLSILYLIDSLAVGGAERSLVEIAPLLVASGVRFEVAVLHDRRGLAPELESAGVPLVVVGGNSRRSWLLHLIRLLKLHRPDLIHTTLFESDVVGRTAAAMMRIPSVTTWAGTPYGPEHRSEPSVTTIRLRGAQLADGASARLARRFHAVSNSTADACIRRLRIPADRVDVIPRGRDRARLGTRSEDRTLRTRRLLGVAPVQPIVLAVSRQEPQKSLETLIDAMPTVLADVPDVILLIAGPEGRSTPELRQAVERSRVGASVRFLGSRDDVADLLCAADVFVLPSIREGLPGAVLEAMAMEVPVVASDLPEIREAVPSDEFAWLVAPGDIPGFAGAIADAISDPSTSRVKAANASHRFKECFDIKVVCEAMIGFYRKALASSSR